MLGKITCTLEYSYDVEHFQSKRFSYIILKSELKNDIKMNLKRLTNKPSKI